MKIFLTLLVFFILSSHTIFADDGEGNIFFKVVSKDKIIDKDNEEACLTKFEVTNNSLYTIYLEEYPFQFHIAPKRYDRIAENGILVNPNLEKNEVEKFDYIDYLEVGMSANIQGYYTSLFYGENSSVLSHTKCKRIKTYVVQLSCDSVNAESVLDINEDDIEWESNKEAYKTILSLLASHPEHDESMGKFQFDRLSSC